MYNIIYEYMMILTLQEHLFYENSYICKVYGPHQKITLQFSVLMTRNFLQDSCYYEFFNDSWISLSL